VQLPLREACFSPANPHWQWHGECFVQYVFDSAGGGMMQTPQTALANGSGLALVFQEAIKRFLIVCA
jgi:hypothetical protein